MKWLKVCYENEIDQKHWGQSTIIRQFGRKDIPATGVDKNIYSLFIHPTPNYGGSTTKLYQTTKGLLKQVVLLR